MLNQVLFKVSYKRLLLRGTEGSDGNKRGEYYVGAQGQGCVWIREGYRT